MRIIFYKEKKISLPFQTCINLNETYMKKKKAFYNIKCMIKYQVFLITSSKPNVIKFSIHLSIEAVF